MLHVKAKISLFKGSAYRKTPFTDGYKPLFNFVENMKKSGKISLINKKEFAPGEEAEVEITFLDKNYLGSDFGKGKEFTFGEGQHIFGEGKIIKVLN